jgi:hypothetical protein
MRERGTVGSKSSGKSRCRNSGGKAADRAESFGGLFVLRLCSLKMLDMKGYVGGLGAIGV